MTEETRSPIRVLIVDDQPLVRMGNALVLDSSEEITVVGEAGTGEEAIAALSEMAVDVVLMDVRMPGMGGIEATRIISAQHPATRIVVLTTFDLDEYAFGALHAGASAFVLKSTTPARLTAAIRTVAAGEAVVEPRITKHLIDHYTGRARIPTEASGVPNPLAVLTRRETEIFLAIGNGLSNPEISAMLHLSPSTVKTHVNRIFSKVGVRDRVHAVILAVSLGVTTHDR